MNKNDIKKLSKKQLIALALALGAEDKVAQPTVVRSTMKVGRRRGENYEVNQTAQKVAKALVAIHSDSRSNEAKEARIYLHSLTGQHSKMRQERASKIIASFGGGQIHGEGLRQSIITIAKRLREGAQIQEILNVSE